MLLHIKFLFIKTRNALFTHETKVNLNCIKGKATPLQKIRVFDEVTVFISIKVGGFEFDKHGLRLAQAKGDNAQCAQALPAVPLSTMAE